jgi:hypothetical protein
MLAWHGLFLEPSSTARTSTCYNERRDHVILQDPVDSGRLCLQTTVPLLLKFLGPILGALIWLVRLAGGLRKQYHPRLRVAMPEIALLSQTVEAMRAHASQAAWCAPCPGSFGSYPRLFIPCVACCSVGAGRCHRSDTKPLPCWVRCMRAMCAPHVYKAEQDTVQ